MVANTASGERNINARPHRKGTEEKQNLRLGKELRGSCSPSSTARILIMVSPTNCHLITVWRPLVARDSLLLKAFALFYNPFNSKEIHTQS